MKSAIVALVVSCCGLLFSADAPRVRSLSLAYTARVKNIPAGTQHLDLWLPVPHSDAFQQIAKLEVHCSYPHQTFVDGLGNRILHVTLDHPQAGSVEVRLEFDATRREHRQLLVHASDAAAPPSEETAHWLKPDRLVPLDNQIRSWAQEVVDAAHAKTDLEKARAIYNHVVSTVKYDKSGKGWGRGDIYYACENRRGNCTDFHAIFIGYARAVGIPARFAIGLPLPAERGVGQIAGYHCWAEFYAQGIGWVPVDASEAAKDPSRREYFFGAHDENRVEFSRGRDLILKPAQAGEPLNYFVYPYAEADGKPFTDVEHVVTYRDVPPALSASGASAKINYRIFGVSTMMPMPSNRVHTAR